MLPEEVVIRPFRHSLLLLLLFLAPAPAAVPPEPPEVTLYAVGDIMLGRYIARVMAARDSGYPFREISSTLKAGDIVFGNLEAVISTRALSPAFPEKPYSFHASGAAAQALKNAGFAVLSLGNNHAMDYGAAALSETRTLLAEKGIAVFGAGSSIADARRPALLTGKGVRFGFLGYSVGHSPAVYAGKDRAGVAPVRMKDIRRDIAALRDHVDVLVVSLHWGTEYETTPSARQRSEARQIIDWGADVIIGHHPHVMQGVEVYKGRIIAYSLGNFVFDQKGNGTDRSFILACRFRDKALASVGLIPVDRFRTYFPRVAAGKVKQDMLEDLKRISLPLNAGAPYLLRAGMISIIGGVPE